MPSLYLHRCRVDEIGFVYFFLFPFPNDCQSACCRDRNKTMFIIILSTFLLNNPVYGKIFSKKNLRPDRSYSGRISGCSHTSICPFRLLSSVEFVRETIFFSYLFYFTIFFYYYYYCYVTHYNYCYNSMLFCFH